jgi:hypothetical protein
MVASAVVGKALQQQVPAMMRWSQRELAATASNSGCSLSMALV